MLESENSFVTRLAAAGVGFIASIDTPVGAETVQLEPGDLAAFLKDKPGWYAQSQGGTREQYLAWLDAGGFARCGERTAKGKPCRNLLSGTLLDFRAWLKADGGQCHVHGGVSSVEARARG